MAFRDPRTEPSPGAPVTRRGFFSRIADGVHGAALASLLGNELFDGERALAASVEPIRKTLRPDAPRAAFRAQGQGRHPFFS